MDDLLIEHGGVRYQFTHSPDGATFEWEWEGCGGTLWFSNDELQALTEWNDKRSPAAGRKE